MSKINFEEDVANIDQDSLESVSGLLQQQLKMETEIEIVEIELQNKKEQFCWPRRGSASSIAKSRILLLRCRTHNSPGCDWRLHGDRAGVATAVSWTS